MYSLNFRKQVLKVGKKEGVSIRDLGKRFGISSRTIVNWKKKLECKIKRNKPCSKVDPEALLKDVELHKDSYYHERASRFKVSVSCIYYALKRLGVSYKKKPSASKGGSRKAIYVLPNSQELRG